MRSPRIRTVWPEMKLPEWVSKTFVLRIASVGVEGSGGPVQPAMSRMPTKRRLIAFFPSRMEGYRTNQRMA